MIREDAKHLLNTLKEHAKNNNIIVDTFLRKAVVEVKCEIAPETVSEEYVDTVIIDKYLLKLAETIIAFQSRILLDSNAFVGFE